MLSFDVDALFTNVPLLEKIDLILERIYDKGELASNFPRLMLQELLLLCTQNPCFIFNGDLYERIYKVTVSSPSGPVFTNIFMHKIETKLLKSGKYYNFCNSLYFGTDTLPTYFVYFIMNQICKCYLMFLTFFTLI